jgi:hypothetical protein
VPVAASAPGVGPGDAAGAILFVTSYGQIWEVISALNSSPWTAENFGADAGKAASAREYLAHSTANGAVIAGIAAFVSRRWYPLIGAGLGIAYAWWIYNRALGRATNSESVGWGSGVDLGLKGLNWGPNRGKG